MAMRYSFDFFSPQALKNVKKKKKKNNTILSSQAIRHRLGPLTLSLSQRRDCPGQHQGMMSGPEPFLNFKPLKLKRNLHFPQRSFNVPLWI